LPDPFGRRRAVSAALLVAAVVISLLPAAAQSSSSPPGVNKFLYALGEVESGGNYYALNKTSGAYGKYQIMPANWPGWAKLYVGSSTAPQSPRNQEAVARGKVTALWHWLDTWPNVAHWWLTGSSERNQALWSSYSKSYVAKIMKLFQSVSGAAALAAARPPVGAVEATVRHIADTSSAIKYVGSWKTAKHNGYAGDRVRYATRDGAKASFTFTARKITWIGPVGETRGKARVSIDGKSVAIVDLQRSTFKPRVNLYSKTWSAPGVHKITIEILSSGRPVAIDEFVTER
jgi:hypothetical protein